MKKILSVFLTVVLFSINTLQAQKTFQVNGVQDERHTWYAFTNAKIVVDYKTILDSATLLIKDGIIEEAGRNVKVPAGAVVYDLKGKYIYPSLIDLCSDYGMPEIKKGGSGQRGNRTPQMESGTKGAYNWNQAVKPETEAHKIFITDPKKAESLRKLGFGAVLSHAQDGIARGSGTVVTLADENENKIILRDRAAAHYSFDKGTSTQDYPSSLMGSIALIRQTYLDAQWYKQQQNKEFNISLDAWNKLQSLPQIFEATDKYSVLRADKIADEFGATYIIKGSGDEYQRLEEIKSAKIQIILPLNYPQAFDVEDPYDALQVTLGEMKHWEMAPSNPGALEKAGIPFALTASDLKDKKEFWKNLRKAIEYGLNEQHALKALTTTPAEMLKLSDKIGALKKGMIANFLITSKNIFDKDNILFENWVQGKQYKINDYELKDLRGNYDLKIDKLDAMKLKINGEITDPAANIEGKDTSSKIRVKLERTVNLISIQFEQKKGEHKGAIRLSGYVSPDGLKGSGQLPNGEWINWNAKFISSVTEEAKKDSVKTNDRSIGTLTFPNKSYGWKEVPKAGNIFIKNATVWTNEQEGILKNTDVLIQNGKISKIGTNIDPASLKIAELQVIDGTGKHLTAGIIDEHSHIAISRGVNEGSQAVTAEVRIGDVINPDDINIYRQLAGGVTLSQLLHGSANPVGGQSGIIKLRWGASPEKMKVENADGFIKFALGENVKQSNWANAGNRYPQTRMGVEQVYANAFQRAKEYDAEWKKYNALPAKEKATAIPPRRDLELETMAEILNKKRFITCHSYVQSEINMLMHLGDSMGFKVNTFTHILEGYKVADKMKIHGAGASTFSDWWAYKFEVYEAIPYNGALLHGVGVTTAFNSDDAEMGRRLNQEAGKAVKYGGVPEEEALKFVTLNPAKLLHLDHRLGSIKTGKDADLVLWSDHPLSINAKSEKTFVDGIAYFDAERDKQLREEIQKERARLIQKMLEAKKKGDRVQKPVKGEEILYHCDTIEGY